MLEATPTILPALFLAVDQVQPLLPVLLNIRLCSLSRICSSRSRVFQTDKPGQVVWHNLLQRLKGARWAYDGFGRMTWRKTGPDAVEQHYRYDDEQRIAEVHFTGHKEFSRAEYRYDALGRRTHKILHRHHKPEETISFLWSGMRMVGESSNLTPDRNTQYLYSEGSWEPLARVDSIGEQADIFWYHT
ncbi:hypothetical protein CQ001_18765, partial [Erwinia billingiae]